MGKDSKRQVTVRTGTEKGNSKPFNLIVQMGDGDFVKSNHAADLPKNKTAYTSAIADMNGYVEAIDRYDDFSQLQIPPARYEKKKGEKYGIKRTATHAGDDVILDHQKKAVARFLKELRGFGLLADIVGSGKTYEACAALCELAVRGRINSMLLIVPGEVEDVYNKWIYVLEMQFGLGEGVLYRADDKLNDLTKKGDPDYVPESFDANFDKLFERDPKGTLIPKRPIIVKIEDFVSWQPKIYDVLFDAIVVDEAHHLCAEEGKYSRAMYGLSRLMQIKKNAGKTYCILCSATPHSGDIEHMFRLWYFIRCNGGEPTDFLEKDDSERTRTYREEREFYRTRVCHGASTVMEFMRKVSVEYAEREFAQTLLDFITKKLDENDLDGDKIKTYKAYANELNRYISTNTPPEKGLTVSEGLGVVSDFLNDRDTDQKIAAKINGYVASEYHNGVLGSIMIRQANRVGKKRTVVNYLFAPVTEEDKMLPLYFHGKTDGAVIDLTKMNGSDSIDDEPSGKMRGGACVEKDGDAISLEEYIAQKAKYGDQTATEYADALFGGKNSILPSLGMTDEVLGLGVHTGTIQYYQRQLQEIRDDSVITRIEPTPAAAWNAGNIDDIKIERLKHIVEVNPDKRILVFFDYDKKSANKKLYAKVEDALRADPAMKGRKLIIGASSGKDGENEVQELVKEFNDTKGAVMLVETAAFTESVDMQTCNIIVNFQIPPDPVAMDQRIGRIFRLGQENDIFIFSLADMRDLEGYVLMYFTRIGLMSSNSGDATIIAGCNSEKSVTVQCKCCGKARMYDEGDYNHKVQIDDPELYCSDTDLCRRGEGGSTRMTLIGTYDFKCDACGKVLSRNEEGYTCFSTHGNYDLEPHIMCNGGGIYDRDIYCHKICAIFNCQKYMEGGPLYGKCKALEKYKSNPLVSEAVLIEACRTCPLNKPGTPCEERCRLYRADGKSGAELIKSCGKCDNSTCSPRPHVFEFKKDKWECACPDPDCRGTMRPIHAHTFADYIRSLWTYKQKGTSKVFCERLGDEAKKVSYIKKILDEHNTPSR